MTKYLGFFKCCVAVGGTTFKKPLITFKKVTTHLNFNIGIIAF